MSTLTRRKGMYTFDGREYPAVSTILVTLAKPALVPWASKLAATAALHDMCDRAQTRPFAVPVDREAWIKSIASASWRASREAAQRGTDVHALAKRIMAGEDVRDADVPEDLRAYVAGVREFVTERDVAVLYAEASVVHEAHARDDHGYAGTLDMIVQLSDAEGLHVADFKTCPSEDKAIVYPEHRMQLAAYRRATTLVTTDGAIPMPATVGGCVVHVWPGGYRCTDLGDDAADYAAFGHLRDVWAWKRAVDANAKGGDDE